MTLHCVASYVTCWQSHKQDETSTDCKVCCRGPATKDRRVLRDSPQEEQWAGRSLRTSLLLIPLTPTWLTLAFLPLESQTNLPRNHSLTIKWARIYGTTERQYTYRRKCFQSWWHIERCHLRSETGGHCSGFDEFHQFKCGEKRERSSAHVSFTGNRLRLSLFSKPFFCFTPSPQIWLGLNSNEFLTLDIIIWDRKPNLCKQLKRWFHWCCVSTQSCASLCSNLGWLMLWLLE